MKLKKDHEQHIQDDGRNQELSLSDCDARSSRKHPSRNVHRHKFLEKELGRVRDMDLRDLGFVLARSAFERILLQVSMPRQPLEAPHTPLSSRFNLRNRGHQPTDVTNVNSEGIRHFEQPLLQESACTM